MVDLQVPLQTRLGTWKRLRAAGRELLWLIPPRRRKLGVLLVGLAFIVTMTESIAALLIFVLLSRLTSAEEELELPLLGDLNQRFPHMSPAEVFALFAAFVAIFFVVRAVLTVTQTYLQNRLAQNAGVALSDRLLAGYMNMPYQLYLLRNSAELIRNTTESVSSVVGFVFLPMVLIISETLLVFGVSAVLLVKAPLATSLAGVLLGSLILLLLRWTQPRVAALGRINQDVSETALRTLQHSLTGLRDIRIAHREGFFQALFYKSRSESARTKYVRATLADFPRVVVETILVLLILSFLLVHSTQQGPDEAPIAVLGLMAYAILRVVPPINRISANINNLRFGRAAMSDLYMDLRLIEEEHPSSTSIATATPSTSEFQNSLQLDCVVYRYPGSGRPVLRDISFTLPRGATLGVVGPTGSGKSTLLDVMMGLLAPQSGRVLIDGRILSGREAAWQAKIGVVSQTVFLLDDTLRRNIAFGLPDEEIDEELLRKCASIAQLDEVLTSLPKGLETRVGDRGTRLSGGQRQRVAIARALYLDPDVLIFDEATSALDSSTEARLLAAIEESGDERTTIMVAHRLATIRDCDQVIVLVDGSVVDKGSYDELVARNAEFRELAGLTAKD